MRRQFLTVLLLGSFSLSAMAKIAPRFQSETMDGERVTLSTQLKPGRMLLLTFWASWCVPCLEELRQVSEKLKTDPSLPLDVLTVNVDTSETSADVKPTLKLHKFSFPVVLDPKHEIFGKYHDSKTLPYSVLVNPQGEIVSTFNGYHEEMIGQVKTALAPQVKSTKETKETNAPEKSEKAPDKKTSSKTK